ncbi:hypothetical protein NSQ96_15360 [Caldifermentibacillus hisashii]|uniref:hypothetical protein n=1 Tax=Caldifermentibacillus hisashii TaxID=996558 RepID=UPI0031FDEE27
MIAHVEIERDINPYKHALVTVVYDDYQTAQFLIGRDTSDKRARELAGQLKLKKKKGELYQMWQEVKSFAK